MPETTQASARTCSLQDCIADMERKGKINPPFTEAERDMAHALAAAWYFYVEQMELPARAPADSPAFLSFGIGIARLLRRRDGSWLPSHLTTTGEAAGR